MAAGLGFKDFVTGEVLTAADVDGYLMQGIWVFASAAARNAAVTSPQEGNSCYLKDTDVIQVYSGSAWVTKSGGSPLTTKGDLYTYSTTDARLAVGANGTTLVADSAEATGLKWATASSGGMTLISTTSLSGATTTLSSIPQTYNSLFLVIAGMTANTSDAQFRAMLNNSTNAHSFSRIAAATTAAFTNDRITLSSTTNTSRSNADNVWSLTIDNYTSSTRFKPITWHGRYVTSAVANETIFAAGGFTDTTAVTSIVFDYGGTNTFAGGTVLLYGVK